MDIDKLKIYNGEYKYKSQLIKNSIFGNLKIINEQLYKAKQGHRLYIKVRCLGNNNQNCDNEFYKCTADIIYNQHLNGCNRCSNNPVHIIPNINEQINNWIVYSKPILEDQSNKIDVKCICDSNNELMRVSIKYIYNNIGCKKCRAKRFSGNNSHNWSGSELISGRMIANWKKNAILRQIDWFIDTKEYDIPIKLNELLISQNNICKLCGREMVFEANNRNKLSLDRIDPMKGYEIGNLMFICKTCNESKWDKTVDEYLHLCRRTIAYTKINRGKMKIKIFVNNQFINNMSFVKMIKELELDDDFTISQLYQILNMHKNDYIKDNSIISMSDIYIMLEQA